MKKIAMILVATLFAVACSKDSDNSGNANDSNVYSVKVTGVDEGEVSVVAIVFDGKTETFTNLSGSSWTSNEYTANSTFAASVSGTGTSAKSSLKIQLLRGGVVVKEANPTGVALTGSVSDGAFSYNNLDKIGTFSVKAFGSNGVKIDVAAISFDGTAEGFSSLSGNSWTSKEYAISTVFAASVSASGNDNSTLTLQLIKDGEVIKESTANGSVLTASVSL